MLMRVEIFEKTIRGEGSCKKLKEELNDWLSDHKNQEKYPIRAMDRMVVGDNLIVMISFEEYTDEEINLRRKVMEQNLKKQRQVPLVSVPPGVMGPQ